MIVFISGVIVGIVVAATALHVLDKLKAAVVADLNKPAA